jgi:sulfite dehydrogenase
MTKLYNHSRRNLLIGSAGSVVIAGLASFHKTIFAQAAAEVIKPLPPYVAWKDPKNFIVHSSTTIETKRSAFGTSIITPSDQLFIRNNLPAPNPSIVTNRDAWEISIRGVKEPRVFTLAELKGLGLETTAAVLQCSGNGRGYFPSKPSGTPWTVGAAGCVIWSGVPVRMVAQTLGGVLPNMKFITGTGGEKLPDGIDPKNVIVERSVPLAAMQDALLAWEMNGSPVPLAHGGPLRLIVPGYTGVNNIKYIKELTFSAQESDAKIMSHGYRMTPQGGKSDPSQPSVQEMNIKSWINSPFTDSGPVRPGKVQIQGVAFGGLHAVKGVEVSINGGKTWQQARFVGPDLGKYAWRQFVLETLLGTGSYTLASRATDTSGKSQPETRGENLSGYNNNSWIDHSFNITVA